MLVDRLASRVKAASGGAVNYLTYGGSKLVGYELDPVIAEELGVAPREGVPGEKATNINRAALEQLRRQFLRACPDFRSFVEPGAGRAKAEKAYKVEAANRVQVVRSEPYGEAMLGKATYEILRTAAKTGPFVRWETENRLAKQSPDLLEEFYGVIGRLIQSSAPAEEALQEAEDALVELRERGAGALTFGERLNILFSALAMVRPREAAPIRIDFINKIWMNLVGEDLFIEKNQDISVDYRRFAKIFSKLFSVMQDEWAWEPQDWFDIQGFLFVALETGGGSDAIMSKNPLNLILYGPPGTGKTYTTAAEAVRLCDQLPETDPMLSDSHRRADLMTRYRELVSEGRVQFTTFHQSYSYEEFVEGLRPTTGARYHEEMDSEAGTDTSSAGFRLVPHDGLFKAICERARLDTGGTQSADRLDRTRHVFKVALGAKSDQAELIQKGLENSVIHLGWGGNIDWSDECFDGFESIRAEWNEKVDPNATGKDANIEQIYALRSSMQVGDYVAISEGRDVFIAFGRVTGEYFFDAEAESHPHKRPVEWLWRDPTGLPREAFYPRNFRRHSIYKLDSDAIDWDGLESSVLQTDAFRPAEEARDYVLIIDEINRANISKVFGELITLLEPDKRLGQLNEIRLKLPYSGSLFGVPANLHVIGTMNTADRSIALLDTALRRRFRFRELMPDPTVLSDDVDGIDMQRMLTVLNQRIEYLFDREHQIGHAYFTGCNSQSDVEEVMRHSVIPLLAEYFYEDWSRIASVLGDQPNGNGRFLRSEKIPPPGAANEEDDGFERLRWSVKESFDFSEFM